MHAKNLIIHRDFLHTDQRVLATDIVVSGSVHLEEEINCVGTEGDIDECPRMVASECLNIGAGVICPNGTLNKFVVVCSRGIPDSIVRCMS